MKISVVGTGYVGLVSGVCLAEVGHEVVCVDVDATKVAKINDGVPPIYERGLEVMLQRNLEAQRMRATTDLRAAVLESELSLIAVGTPFDGSAIDLKYIREVARQIGAILREKDGYHVVVVKSTVVPGTTETVVLPILEAASGKRAGADFGVGMNPEFLREGEAIDDFMHPDRIVLGGIDERSIDALDQMYAVFSSVDKLRTSPKTAEMIKYTANSLLATLISFSNEIGNLCAAVGNVDVVEVMQGVHLDKRLSPILASGDRVVPVVTTYLEAGCGFGGSCFPKDVKALIAFGRDAGQPMQLLDAVVELNQRQPQQVLDLLRRHYPELKGVRVAVLGLAFKPDTDDVRESPALPVVWNLLEHEAEVVTYDPIASHEAKKVFRDAPVTYCASMAEAVQGAQAVLIMTRWAEFKDLPKLLASLEHPPLVVDGRRMLDKHSVAHYEGIGL
ncbi:MAG: UDP-glucose dehydrogenase family protein [Oscillochloridaceae bacterium umkhey_bin13]